MSSLSWLEMIYPSGPAVNSNKLCAPVPSCCWEPPYEGKLQNCSSSTCTNLKEITLMFLSSWILFLQVVEQRFPHNVGKSKCFGLWEESELGQERVSIVQGSLEHFQFLGKWCCLPKSKYSPKKLSSSIRTPCPPKQQYACLATEYLPILSRFLRA